MTVNLLGSTLNPPMNVLGKVRTGRGHRACRRWYALEVGAITCAWLWTFACSFFVATLAAQQPAADQTVEINLGDGAELELDALVGLASNNFNLRIHYDQGLIDQGNKKIVFRGAAKLTRETFLVLLQATLRARGLALVDGDVPDFKMIVRLQNARAFSPIGQASQFGKSEFMTEIFYLKNVSATQAASYVRTFLYDSSGGTGAPNTQTNNAVITTIPEANLLVVTDFVANMIKIENLISRIDVPPRTVVQVFYDVQHMDAANLREQLSQIITARRVASSIRGPLTTGRPNTNQDSKQGALDDVQVLDDVRTNRLILIGPQETVDGLRTLISELDVPLNQTTKVYQFENISADRIDRMMRQTLGEDNANRTYHAVIDEQANRLIVTSRADVHLKIEALKTELDQPPSVDATNSPVRFYRLKNVKVIDVLDTLQSIARDTQVNTLGDPAGLRSLRVRDNFDVSGPNFINPSRLEGAPPLPPGLRDAEIEETLETLPLDEESFSPEQSIIPGEARLTVDENTNTLIVVAEPAVQALYADLIEKLDRRRPQVLIEATVVAISGQETVTVGIEVSGGDRSGGKRLFAFTSSGLSTINPANGFLSLIPGLGGNGTLVDPDTADVVLRALATNRSTRIVTAPKILVNDNATGELASVAEVPFASINASNVVSTTSFAGFAEAGTTVRVTPHISEGDHLQLEYNVTINDFTGTAAPNLPPPRQTEQATSEITIPDGHTIIVGGLRRRRLNSDYQGLPIINNIPVLRLIQGIQSHDSQWETLFVFIKPIILRDDKFEDLRFLSDRDINQADIPGTYPYSEPVLIR